MPILHLRGAEEWVPAFAGTTMWGVKRFLRLMMLALLLLAAALLTLGAGGALLLNLGHFRESFHQVEHADEVLRQMSATEVALFQAESNERAM